MATPDSLASLINSCPDMGPHAGERGADRSGHTQLALTIQAFETRLRAGSTSEHTSRAYPRDLWHSDLFLHQKHAVAELLILQELLEDLIPVTTLDHFQLDHIQPIAGFPTENPLLLHRLKVGICGWPSFG